MELIDKNALKIKLIGEELDAYAKADFRFAQALSIFHGLISKAPIVEERKNGHWKCEDYLLGTTHRCSRCGENYGMPHKIYNFCPNCGAKMENNGDNDNE